MIEPFEQHDSNKFSGFTDWLSNFFLERNISLWNGADLTDFKTPVDREGNRFSYALAWATPMNPQIMESIQAGPNQPYADEYQQVNSQINETADLLTNLLEENGHQASALPASKRTDHRKIRGDFPHKTAATRAGLGWVGSNCQLITKPFGPWVRLGTVFTNMTVPVAKPIDKNYCGECKKCVDACPAKALSGNRWSAGVERHTILDAKKCDDWKKKHYFQYHKGHNCGICSAVCPYGTKVLKKKSK